MAEAGNVPRETGLRATTAPPTPAAAAALCGSGLPALIRYADLLADRGVAHGLIGPREVPRLWDRHILNCAAIAPALPPSATVVDLGSGAGLPGVVLAVVRPDLTMTLLEPLARRVDFLCDAVAFLGLDNVTVFRGRAEESVRSLPGGPVDIVTSRAVAPLGRLTGWALPLLRPGGVMLAIKGRSAAAEVESAEREMRAAGASFWGVEQRGSEVLDEPTTVVRVVRGAATMPRRSTRRFPER